ncbi:hypothetical protein [Acinetobacter brisouii]
MGMNIAGCIVKKVITSQYDLEELFGAELEFQGDISFAEACDLERDENTIDVYCNAVGCLIIYHAGQSYDVSDVKEDIIQFVLFSLANSYFFEQYHQGKLQRRYMIVNGEVHEDEGTGVLQEGDDVEVIVKQLLDDFLEAPISKQLDQLELQRYAFIEQDDDEADETDVTAKLPH